MKHMRAARWTVVVLGALSMAITLPSCPGQEAMQQQIDQHQTQITSMTKRVAELENQVKALNTDMGQAKTFLPQIAQAIQAQKAQLDAIDVALKEIQARSAKGGKPRKR